MVMCRYQGYAATRGDGRAFPLLAACPSSVEPLAPVALIESVATIVPESRCQQAAGRFSIATYPSPVHFELLPSVALIESAGQIRSHLCQRAAGASDQG